MSSALYEVKYTSQFKRDYRAAIKRGEQISLLDELIRTLANGVSPAEKHRDHALTGNFRGYRECHITPDWLLIYRRETDLLVLTLTRTGSHSELF